MGDRGVGHLYEPARAGNSDALCLTAARFFMDLKAGEHVFLLTGSLTRNWVSKRIAETDGPIGTAVLARTLSYGFNAIPVVLISSQRPVSGEFQPSALATAVTKLEWEMCRMPLPGLFLLETRFARFRRRTCYYLAVYRTGALTRSRQPSLCWALSRLFPGVGKRHFRIHANGQCFALSCKAVVKPPVFASLGNEQIQPLLIGELMGLCPRICVARFDIG